MKKFANIWNLIVKKSKNKFYNKEMMTLMTKKIQTLTNNNTKVSLKLIFIII